MWSELVTETSALMGTIGPFLGIAIAILLAAAIAGVITGSRRDDD